ncbi:MAG TPA: VTC domain-containing protein [Polyangiaceae bacterium]|nr:VTC domain-containing protein [Polyangiaceae bacterium]
MSQPAPAASSALRQADERMTAEREETKYLVSASAMGSLAALLNERLPAHHFTGEGANVLPDPHHFVTTVYFDTASHAHLRAALSDVEHNVKVRAKEYYDVHPSLAELATDPAQIVRYQPWMWFELKRREGATTSKRRFRLPKREVPAFFSGQCSISEQSLSLDPSEVACAGEIVAYFAKLQEPLLASCVVNYRRFSWQDAQGALRVTIDLGLSFYAPPGDLWSRERALVRSTLGTAAGTERCAVLEVKRRGPLPEWLTRALSSEEVRPLPFSKFVAASQAVHGQR